MRVVTMVCYGITLTKAEKGPSLSEGVYWRKRRLFQAHKTGFFIALSRWPCLVSSSSSDRGSKSRGPSQNKPPVGSERNINITKLNLYTSYNNFKMYD
ncbi:hypothetical protein AVEN_237090-1 [Araneus ventricosus]|uniref:Uncharacterized protein n=1 Tax=Araneus ventricosus TaxID=182803 RepID=A0A4Y2NME1_ARAVE|nr:hypothetical protein AVEN_237090-1 [Araneus ventricosus]